MLHDNIIKINNYTNFIEHNWIIFNNFILLISLGSKFHSS